MTAAEIAHVIEHLARLAEWAGTEDAYVLLGSASWVGDMSLCCHDLQDWLLLLRQADGRSDEL